MRMSEIQGVSSLVRRRRFHHTKLSNYQFVNFEMANSGAANHQAAYSECADGKSAQSQCTRGGRSDCLRSDYSGSLRARRRRAGYIRESCLHGSTTHVRSSKLSRRLSLDGLPSSTRAWDI